MTDQQKGVAKNALDYSGKVVLIAGPVLVVGPAVVSLNLQDRVVDSL